jgi:Flp pilus assembly protein TadD
MECNCNGRDILGRFSFDYPPKDAIPESKTCCPSGDPLMKSATPARLISRSPAGASARTEGLRKEANSHRAARRWAQAIAAFRDIARLKPESAEAHHDLGAALFDCGLLAEAAVSLSRAVELRPSFDAALRRLANAQEELGRESEAAVAYRRLSRLSKNAIERRLLLGKALTLEGAAEEAELELRRAVTAAPSNPGAHVLLGQLLLENGQFEEAELHLIQALEAFPDSFQHLAASRRINEADRPLLDQVLALADRKGLVARQRAAVHFGLGKSYDDLADYERAMQNYDTANRLRDAASRFDRDGLAAHYDQLISSYTATDLNGGRTSAQNKPSSDDDLPVLIVGMPRSGTTLAEQILSAHPEITAGGELSFWSDRVKQWLAQADEGVARMAGFTPAPDMPMGLPLSRATAAVVEKSHLAFVDRRTPRVRSMSLVELAQAGRDYLTVIRRIGPEARRVIDKAPFNFERLGQIRSALPAIRIIHCRRQPVDTCLSIFFTNYKGRQAWSRADLLFHYRQYERLMGHWRSILPSDRFIELDYEAVVADREAQSRRLIAFCGLEWSDACLATEANRGVIRSASLWQARQPTYTRSLDRWRHYEPWLGEFRDLLTTGPSEDADD